MKGSPMGEAGNVKGLDAIREKGRQWQEGIEEMHGGKVGDPVIAGDWFSGVASIDATCKKRRGCMDMEDICSVYQVRQGVRAVFLRRVKMAL